MESGTAVIVYVWVKDGCADAFVEATSKNAFHSRQEHGNLRFDMVKSTDEENKFLLFESYQHQDQARAHCKTPHYLEWRETVEPMMARRREKELCVPVSVPLMVSAPEEADAPPEEEALLKEVAGC
eukprot:TRINITY_DN2587_c0_g3_i1.p1 TRINITY_DN2587_c0_g3~~TRINITY_DN2587_c0_g3_i1.p1  ORF type:complete len:126 (+),score=26.39 TRINITY_DN2587_c0_g3_i1:193-570(+)